MTNFLGKYESLLMKMSAWIAEATWDGHEKECPAFAGASGECCCIKAIRDEWHKTARLREIEELHAPPKRELQDFTPLMMQLQADNLSLRNDLLWARWRINDMLMGDDGAAWSEARKFQEKMEAKYGPTR